MLWGKAQSRFIQNSPSKGGQSDSPSTKLLCANPSFNRSEIMLKFLATFILLISLTAIVSAQGRSTSSKWLNGTWEGTGYQIDANETWTMKLTVRGRAYRIEYPSIKCGGRWIPLSITQSRGRFIEKIIDNLETCTNNGYVVIERLSRRQIAFRYSNPGSREVIASAILNRKK
jgi:hypothetical protein